MPGIYRGVPKHSTRPIVDGIVTGVPRKPHPSLATPTEAPVGDSATHVPKAAFGSGIFGEGAGPVGHGKSSHDAGALVHRGRGRPKKEEHARERSSSGTPIGHGTKKGEMRKTARRAYEK